MRAGLVGSLRALTSILKKGPPERGLRQRRPKEGTLGQAVRNAITFSGSVAGVRSVSALAGRFKRPAHIRDLSLLIHLHFRLLETILRGLWIYARFLFLRCTDRVS